jgi:hypothetical protein
MGSEQRDAALLVPVFSKIEDDGCDFRWEVKGDEDVVRHVDLLDGDSFRVEHFQCGREVCCSSTNGTTRGETLLNCGVCYSVGQFWRLKSGTDLCKFNVRRWFRSNDSADVIDILN